MAQRLGCIGTVMLAGLIGWPLTQLGVPDNWAYGTGIGIVLVVVGWPIAYAYRQQRQRT